ncbi:MULTISPECIES: hypothetical protein [unclassified Endozoicomonas]|uniref:hypothetical protein n=1 Tax=unclassified Endozoicomonas TaxID=2644528 RepID=UPI002148D5D4|nr:MULTISPECIES: hypothetical protein [unclassified Endozoicomonas]
MKTEIIINLETFLAPLSYCDLDWGDFDEECEEVRKQAEQLMKKYASIDSSKS